MTMLSTTSECLLSPFSLVTVFDMLTCSYCLPVAFTFRFLISFYVKEKNQVMF